MNSPAARWFGRSIGNRLITLANVRGVTHACHPPPPAVSKGDLRFESPGVPRSGLRPFAKENAPLRRLWGPFGGRQPSGSCLRQQVARPGAYGGSRSKPRPLSGHRNGAAAHFAHFRRANRRCVVRWRGAPPPSNGLRSCPKRFSRSARNVVRIPARASALGPLPRLGVAS